MIIQEKIDQLKEAIEDLFSKNKDYAANLLVAQLQKLYDEQRQIERSKLYDNRILPPYWS